MFQEPAIDKTRFLTPDRIAHEQGQQLESARGRLLLASCRSGSMLAHSVAERYWQLMEAEDGDANGVLLADMDYQFSDSETCVRLDRPVCGADVFLFQALYDPTHPCGVDHNYMALLIAARALREHGANHVTGVVPYLAYGRQDKPTKFMREPTTARLMADLCIQAGIDRIITWAPHTEQARGFYGGIPVEMLDSLTLFIEEYRRFTGCRDVIVVAPDAGASKFVTYFGRALDLDCAIASKFRPRREEAKITEVIGDFSGKRTAIVLDDMMSSGGTIQALIKHLVQRKHIEEVYLGVSHNLCLEVARERLVELNDDYRLRDVVVTNSIPQTMEFTALPFVSVRSLSDPLARTINRVHYNRSVSELFIKVGEDSPRQIA